MPARLILQESIKLSATPLMENHKEVPISSATTTNNEAKFGLMVREGAEVINGINNKANFSYSIMVLLNCYAILAKKVALMKYHLSGNSKAK